MGRLLFHLLAVLCLLVAVFAMEESSSKGNAKSADFTDYNGKYGKGEDNKYDDEYDNKKGKGSDSHEDYDDYDDYSDDKDDDDDKWGKGSSFGKFLNSPAQSQPQVRCQLGVQFMSHPFDCTQFYQCAHGVPFLMTCPAGLHFNVDLNVCDWPSNANCQGYQYDQNDDDSYPSVYSKPTYISYQKPDYDNDNYNNIDDNNKNNYNNYNNYNKGYEKKYDGDDDDDDNGKNYSDEDDDDHDHNDGDDNDYSWDEDNYGGYNNKGWKPEPELRPKQYWPKPNYQHNYGPYYPSSSGNAYYRPTSYNNVPAMHHHQHKTVRPMHPQPMPEPEQEPEPKHKGVYQPTNKKEVTYYYYDYDGDDNGKGDNGPHFYVPNGNGWNTKGKFKNGALTNPGFFGKAFEYLETDKNIFKGGPAQYIHHDHTSSKLGNLKKGKGGSKGSLGGGFLGSISKLFPLLLLTGGLGGNNNNNNGNNNNNNANNNNGLLTLLLLGGGLGGSSKGGSLSLGGLGGSKGKGKGGKGSNDLLETIILLNLFRGNNNNNNNNQLVPNVQQANGQIVSVATNLPVILVNPITGLQVNPANAQVDQTTGQIVDATGQPLGVLNPLTGEVVNAVSVVNNAPAGAISRAPAAGRTGPLVGLGRSPLIPQGAGGNRLSSSRDSVNLVFLSPLTPSSLPPAMSTDSQSATYIRGTLKELLGDDLSRFLATRSLNVDRPINSAASSSGKTCSVSRGDKPVTMKLAPQNGRRLSTQECAAMGNLLDKFMPTFLQNFVPDDVTASGLGTKRNSKDNNKNNNNKDSGDINISNVDSSSSNNNNNNNNDNAGSQSVFRNIFGQRDSRSPILPSLIPARFQGNANAKKRNNNDKGENGSTSNSESSKDDVTFLGIGGEGNKNNINDFITVRNDASGCNIVVPTIVTEC